MTDPPIYTAITFAPVQGFIEKSRKLRDLYGSSFILSYLSREICLKAGEENVVSPAIINLTQGTPNFLIIRGHFPKDEAETALNQAWRRLAKQCRYWIERELSHFRYEWDRDWNLWISHAWEFFWATGSSIDQACDNLGAVKQSRRWTGINWTGESSTLSGADAIAWPGMGRIVKAQKRSFKEDDTEILSFYQALKQRLDGVVGKIEDTVEPDRKEQLSIPELIKRLVTYSSVVNELKLPQEERSAVEIPPGFRDLNRFEEDRWTGWFKGDGDRMGQYLKTLDEQQRKDFSRAIMNWGEKFKKSLPHFEKSGRKSLDPDGRVIYAGGDDFLGVLYRNSPDPDTATPHEIADFNPLTAADCMSWFQQFPQIWRKHDRPITVSVGVVWAAPKVPQRDVLQHCNAAESNAKQAGRDRIALRVLFNNSTHLEWICPWRFLPVLQDYRDPQNGKRDWVRLYKDIAELEARHAFRGDQADVAVALLRVYFQRDGTDAPESLWNESDHREFYHLINAAPGDELKPLDFKKPGWWNCYNDEKKLISTGVLGDREHFLKDEEDGKLDLKQVHQAVNDWIVSLAKVGFHLCSDT